MRETETKKYKQLNQLSESQGIVIFGNGEDKTIPLGELRQAFSIEQKIYNRSFENLSIKDAIKAYEDSILPLSPETLLIHLGEADILFFTENATEFDNYYRKLIHYIKSQNTKCHIGIVSMRNYNNNIQIEEMNRHLKYIAESEECDYGDISNKKVWNPISTMDISSFVYSIGFVHTLKNKHPFYDLIKIFFCYET